MSKKPAKLASNGKTKKVTTTDGEVEDVNSSESNSDSVLAELKSESRELIVGRYTATERPKKEEESSTIKSGTHPESNEEFSEEVTTVHSGEPKVLPKKVQVIVQQERAKGETGQKLDKHSNEISTSMKNKSAAIAGSREKSMKPIAAHPSKKSKTDSKIIFGPSLGITTGQVFGAPYETIFGAVSEVKSNVKTATTPTATTTTTTTPTTTMATTTTTLATETAPTTSTLNTTTVTGTSATVEGVKRVRSREFLPRAAKKTKSDSMLTEKRPSTSSTSSSSASSMNAEIDFKRSRSSKHKTRSGSMITLKSNDSNKKGAGKTDDLTRLGKRGSLVNLATFPDTHSFNEDGTVTSSSTSSSIKPEAVVIKPKMAETTSSTTSATTTTIPTTTVAYDTSKQTPQTIVNKEFCPATSGRQEVISVKIQTKPTPTVNEQPIMDSQRMSNDFEMINLAGEEAVDEALAKQLQDKFEEIQKNFQQVPKTSGMSTLERSSILTPPSPTLLPSIQPTDVSLSSANVEPAVASSLARATVQQMQKDATAVQRLTELLQPTMPIEATLQSPLEASLNISLNEPVVNIDATSSSSSLLSSSSSSSSSTSRQPTTQTINAGSVATVETVQNRTTPPLASQTLTGITTNMLTNRLAPLLSSRPMERKLCAHCNAMHCDHCGCRPILVAIIIICIGLCLYLKFHRN